jgi:phospholipase B1
MNSSALEAFAPLLYKNALVWEEDAKNKPKNAAEPMIYFDCETFGPTPGGPSSVHALRPGDIDVVMAMGDSITAGFGAESGNIFQIFTEYRGVSWSIGGDDTVSTILTVPNGFKQYNPDIIGFSVGTGKVDTTNSGLDQAVSGAIGQDMPEQAQTLISILKSNPQYDLENSWKHLTVFIGGNDLCRVCQGKDQHQPDNYIAYVEQALDLLQANIPRLFISLVPFVDVTRLGELSQGLCIPLHWFLCPCGVMCDKWQQAARDAQVAYYQGLINLASQSKYDANDFTVVIQPFMVNTDIPLIPGTEEHDRSYFAPDCFHFSDKAHAAAAVGLWNNLFEPVGDKKTAWVLDEPYECPSIESPYLYTARNSNNGTTV